MEPILTSQKVEKIFAACLFMEGEDKKKMIEVDGVTRIVWFHNDKLEENKQEIESLLGELHDDFRKPTGGNFIKACIDRQGRQWAGTELVVDKLFQLGMAIDKVKYLVQREMWHEMPGGVPYLMISE